MTIEVKYDHIYDDRLCELYYSHDGSFVRRHDMLFEQDYFAHDTHNGDRKTTNYYEYSKIKVTYPHGKIVRKPIYPYWTEATGRLHGRGSTYVPGRVYGFAENPEKVSGFKTLPFAWPSNEDLQNQFVDLDVDGCRQDSYDRAIQKFVDKSRNFDIGIGHTALVDVFESPELLILYRQVEEHRAWLRSKGGFLKLMKRAHPGVVAAEYWLLWQFGIKPLIDSYNKIIATLREGMIDVSGKTKGTSTLERKEIKRASEFKKANLAGGYDKSDPLIHNWYSCRTSIGFDAELIDIDAAIKAQFGLNTPGASFYQSLPLSFVLDWFVNIGGYLQRLEHMASTEPAYKYTNGYKTVTETFYQEVYSSGFDTDYYDSVEFEYRTEITTNRREILTEVPAVPLPKWKPNLSIGKITSLFALGVQFLQQPPSRR